MFKIKLKFLSYMIKNFDELVSDFFNIKMSQHDRKQRFAQIAHKGGLKQTLPLLLTKSISEKNLQKINRAITALLEKYARMVLKKEPICPIIDNLDENFDLLKEMGKKLVGNCLEICEEVKEESKAFHNAVCDAFDELNLHNEIDMIQTPVNLRLKIGDFDPGQEHVYHPLSTSKPHIDIWAGAPASLAICIVELMNDRQGAKIEFSEMSSFPKSLAKTKGSYDGRKITNFFKNFTKNKILSEVGVWNIVDAYTPHQTVYPGRGVRISADFRLSWKDKLVSDFPEHSVPSDFKKYEDRKL
jgi:hypothetical protein